MPSAIAPRVNRKPRFPLKVPPIFLLTPRPLLSLSGARPKGNCKKEKDHDNRKHRETTKKKGSRPTHEIFPVNAKGKPDYKARTGAWAHSKGGG